MTDPITILLADDEAALRRVTERVLLRQGYRVLSAGDGTEALALAERHEGALHLLITDLVMPRMGGLELARRLRTLRPDVRVIYLSGYSDGSPLAEGDVAGTFLEKPFTTERLGSLVREILER